MAEKKKAGGDEILDLDSLLTDDAAPEQESEPENPTLARIREVEAELAKPLPEPAPEPEEFVPTAQLSEDERQLRELEDQLAKRKSLIVANAPTEYDAATGEDVILIHILEDGFVFNGQTWYKGQEVEFVVGSKAYEQTKDRKGWTWLSIAGDQAAQYRKWKKLYIGLGPWPGLPWGAAENLSPEEAEAAKVAATKEAERSRRAPVLRA